MPTPERRRKSASSLNGESHKEGTSAWRLDADVHQQEIAKHYPNDANEYFCEVVNDWDDSLRLGPWDVHAPSPREIKSPRRITPRLVQPGNSTGPPVHAIYSASGGFGEVHHCLQLVVQRLAQMEQRLEFWQSQHDRRLENAFRRKTNRVPSVKKGRASFQIAPRCKSTACETAPAVQEASSGCFAESEEPDAALTAGVKELNGTCKDTGHTGIKMAVSSPLASCGNTEDAHHTEAESKEVEKGKGLDATGAYILGTEMGKYRHNGSSEDVMNYHTSYLHNQNCTQMLQKLVRWTGFDHFFAFVIIVNAIFIAVQTEYLVRTAGAPEDPSATLAFSLIDKVFASMFALELLLRLLATRGAFFCSTGCAWNFFDLSLVLMSLIEVGLEIRGLEDTGAEDTGATRVMRMFRMARVIRVMRVLRFLDELRTMVLLILHSMRSLFWLLVLLSIILFVFSIFFTQGIADYLRFYMDDPVAEDLRTFYGGLADSAFTLFMAITGGVSWIEVVRPLQQTGWVFTGLFILYVSFCVFSVLNIVTGVFVDGAIQRSAQERDLRLEKEKEQKEVYINMLMDLLNEIDTEGTGIISRGMLEEAFERERVKYTFSVLDIDIHDSNYLFDMLDLDRSGEVDMDEFVLGCLRLKGNAKSIDIHTLMFEIRHLIRKWDTLFPDDVPAVVGNPSLD